MVENQCRKKEMQNKQVKFYSGLCSRRRQLFHQHGRPDGDGHLLGRRVQVASLMGT
jgi:hypothetical protein